MFQKKLVNYFKSGIEPIDQYYNDNVFSEKTINFINSNRVKTSTITLKKILFQLYKDGLLYSNKAYYLDLNIYEPYDSRLDSMQNLVYDKHETYDDISLKNKLQTLASINLHTDKQYKFVFIDYINNMKVFDEEINDQKKNKMLQIMYILSEMKLNDNITFFISRYQKELTDNLLCLTSTEDFILNYADFLLNIKFNNDTKDLFYNIVKNRHRSIFSCKVHLPFK
ncbi:MAG: hypothetical protein J0G32_07650 [Alphaproteobacteria bacterium]|jgi:hypothetical protein|nr:hypothetical protein [Alphaproteobacteria bacterium]OJV12538.1 MAG: hypothetical protein BGO27_03340 [Alphaproteobacteria bacterium 33-17]